MLRQFLTFLSPAFLSALCFAHPQACFEAIEGGKPALLSESACFDMCMQMDLESTTREFSIYEKNQFAYCIAFVNMRFEDRSNKCEWVKTKARYLELSDFEKSNLDTCLKN